MLAPGMLAPGATRPKARHSAAPGQRGPGPRRPAGRRLVEWRHGRWKDPREGRARAHGRGGGAAFRRSRGTRPGGSRQRPFRPARRSAAAWTGDGSGIRSPAGNGSRAIPRSHTARASVAPMNSHNICRTCAKGKRDRTWRRLASCCHALRSDLSSVTKFLAKQRMRMPFRTPCAGRVPYGPTRRFFPMPVRIMDRGGFCPLPSTEAIHGCGCPWEGWAADRQARWREARLATAFCAQEAWDASAISGTRHGAGAGGCGPTAPSGRPAEEAPPRTGRCGPFPLRGHLGPAGDACPRKPGLPRAGVRRCARHPREIPRP